MKTALELIADRAEGLLAHYNSWQNPEDVIAEMAYTIATLEAEFKHQDMQAREEIKYLEQEIRDAYSQGEHDGRASCEEHY